jgi:dTDP-4-dehydrorhamnose reductase
MNIVIIGSNGQLGYELTRLLSAEDYTVLALDLPELDIASQDTISKMIPEKSDIIINTAAYTNVDMAEENVESAFSVNKEGPFNLAVFCSKNKIPLIHISTDYVFDGNKTEAYKEDDPVNPVGVYGESKLSGENSIKSVLKEFIIIRTSWLYGAHGNNFVKTMLNLGKVKDSINVVNDQFGCPTFTGDLAAAILLIVKKMYGQFQNSNAPVKTFNEWGVYHFSGASIVSWYEFSKKIFEHSGKFVELKKVKVIPITTEQYPTRAKRPKFSAFDTSLIKRTFGVEVHDLDYSLDNMLKEYLT